MQWGLEHVKRHDLSSLRLLGSVGEPINPAAWHWYYEHIGYSNCPIVDTWWQTETGGIVITTLPGIHTMKPGSAGMPLPGIKADLHFTKEDSAHEAGLLYIEEAMPSMARTIYGDKQRYIDTYWNLNVIASEAKQSSPKTVYLAGDAAIQDQDGYIIIEGRIDDVINVSGHRLGTAEIESALVAHELVSEAAVVSIPHPIKGEGIVAYVVISNCHPKAPERREGDVRVSSQNQRDPDALQAQDDIIEQLKEQVVKEIGSIAKPEQIIICKALPKTRSGKIMRRLLKDIAQGKEPSGDISTLEDKQVLLALSPKASKIS
jgi:acetyl-CoA synthetase